MSARKSLTDPPKNLKEAIDCVLRVSGRDNGNNDDQAIKGLAEELITLLDKDAGEVARGVLGVMGGTFDKVVGDLKTIEATVYSKALQTYLSNVKRYFTTVSDYGTAVPEQRRKTFIKCLENDAKNGTGGPVSALADGLKKFIGYGNNGQPAGNGIIKNGGSYQSAYHGKQWSDIEDQKNVCANIFLGVAPLIFYLLPFLYWKCKLTDEGGWTSKKLSDEPLKKFMEKMGFKTELNDSKKDSEVATLIGSTCFSELETAYNAAKKGMPNPDPYYATVIRKLELSQTKLCPSTSPLSRCYRIVSPFFTPNSTYDVQSSSPATPSFLGYSGLGALAGGAYGFNLGGLGTFMSALLA
ncbi:uncharacterized protein BcabD6B2_21570 [Babesia caballi]|uniref:Uncharacterized protein n=1 Tax=Babesia caballi TaxID=5871 RepID=A0AAV4LR51_BABCB|nr:hypothetical protein, conserved [Babesia caballi]